MVVSSSTEAPSSLASGSSLDAFGCYNYLRTVFESVYRCDSAVVVEVAAKRAANCCFEAVEAAAEAEGPPAKEATANEPLEPSGCGGCGGVGGFYADTLKDSMASRPFSEYNCFCDDNDFDFVVAGHEEWNHCGNPLAASDENNNNNNNNTNNTNTTRSDHRDDRNEDDGVRGSKASDGNATTATTETDETASGEEPAVTVLRSKWTAHTKNFYSKIGSPTRRAVTKLSDVVVVTASANANANANLNATTPPTRPVVVFRRPLSIDAESSSIATTNSNHHRNKDKNNKNNNDNNKNVRTIHHKRMDPSTSSSSTLRWIPRKVVSESREE